MNGIYDDFVIIQFFNHIHWVCKFLSFCDSLHFKYAGGGHCIC
jgi:hypothetical protein